MKLTAQDISNILSKYNLGELKHFKPLERRLSTLNPSLIITTTKGKFFLKVYTKQFKRFRYHILKGLDLLLFLEKKKYPSIRVFKSKDKRPYTIYKGTTFAIFEFMNLKEKRISNTKQAYELGKYLGNLHKLTKTFPLNKIGQGYDSFKKELDNNFHLAKKAPKKYKEILEYIKSNFSKLKVPPNQPKSVCHVEFTSQHIRFKGKKLVKVIDWDEVSNDNIIYDLGTSMAECFNNGKINFKLLASLIKGYESQRKLTAWEKEHLFEAIFFGICKFVIWGLDKEEIQKSGWNKHAFEDVKYFIDLGKEEFNKKLN